MHFVHKEDDTKIKQTFLLFYLFILVWKPADFEFCE